MYVCSMESAVNFAKYLFSHQVLILQESIFPLPVQDVKGKAFLMKIKNIESWNGLGQKRP